MFRRLRSPSLILVLHLEPRDECTKNMTRIEQVGSGVTAAIELHQINFTLERLP